jgi:hypothetical protein
VPLGRDPSRGGLIRRVGEAVPIPTTGSSTECRHPDAWDFFRGEIQRIMPAHLDRSKAVSMLASLGFVLVLGCGDETGLGRRYPVSGTVTYKGQAVAKGSISFRPTEGGGRPASGNIAGGTYSLTTAADNDGALPGTYQVSIIARDADVTKAQEEARAKNKVVFLQKVAAQTHKAAKSLIPTKYESPNTSGLTREVKEQSNRIDFDLTD